MCVVRPKLPQVNQSSFPNLTSFFTNWRTLLPRWMGVEGSSRGSWLPAASGPEVPAPKVAAARVRSKRGLSLQSRGCSLCASESRRPTSLSVRPIPAGPPGPRPVALGFAFVSLLSPLRLLYPVKKIQGKDLESKLEDTSTFTPPPAALIIPCSFPTFLLRIFFPPPKLFFCNYVDRKESSACGWDTETFLSVLLNAEAFYFLFLPPLVERIRG